MARGTDDSSIWTRSSWGLTLIRGRHDADVQARGPYSGWDLLWRLWPMQLIAWGLASMLKGWRDGRLAGGGLLLVGALLQLEMLRLVQGLRVVAPGPGRGSASRWRGTKSLGRGRARMREWSRHMEPRARIRITGQLILGMAIAALGLLFTLDNLDILDARDYLRYWPVVLIVVGLVHIAQARTAAGMFGGAIWIVVGAALLGNRLDYLRHEPLGLLAVAAGARRRLRIVWQAVSTDAPGQRSGDDSAIVSAVAVMGGFDRRSTSTEFRGGELTAFMGGGKLDLREATHGRTARR